MPTIDIPDKICPHCGGTSWKIEYRKKAISLQCVYSVF